jgi:Transposase DDE domain
MFFRVKPSGPRRYLQIVENRRVEGAVRQTVIATLGRLDELQASGALTALMASGAKFVDQIVLLDALAGDESSLSTKRIGAPLLFGRLWRRLGIDAVLDKLAGERAFEFPVERAIFVATLHRLLVSGSDRDCDAWRADYDIAGTEGLKLHHFYRAMAWLGEELEAKAPGALAPRCLKDVIEEALFDANRSLFTQVRAVFMDTTSLSFYGEGGETLGERGYSKDYRPDLHQMILALVMDGAGRPLCTEMVPGNTADVTTLLPVVDRLRQRFCIDEVCVVADRGMISAQTIAALEARKLTYILGTRERTDTTARALVLDDQAPFVPLVLERQRKGETQLFIKKRVVAGKTYIVCRNEEEAEHDRRERQALVEVLNAHLKRGDKALIGNAGYRRYLRKADAKAGASFEIDAGKLAEEARFDGIFVLRTNANLTPLQVVMRYRDLPANAMRSSGSGREPFPACQGGDAYAPDLPFQRPSHSRSCLLLLPRARLAQGTRRHPRQGRPGDRMGRHQARPRPPARSSPRPQGQGLADPHRRRTGHRFSIPRRSDRAAAARQTDQSASTQAHASTKTQTRQAKAWCHVNVNFANLLGKPML